MDRPLDIAFHGIEPSPAIEEEIRTHFAKLEKRFGHLTSGRVSVEALHAPHQTGNLYEVHVTLAVPGRDLAVSREPHRARERSANPDLRGAVRDAFKAAERQLEAFKGRLREDTSAPSGSALAGQVALIEPGQDHGFILTSTGSQLYFHRDAVTDSRFEDLRPGMLVHYVEEDGSAGPTAAKIRVSVKGTT